MGQAAKPTRQNRTITVDFQDELVASFANRSNLLKEWEKTDTCAVSAYGAHGLKNAAITRIPDHALPRSPPHFSDRTALVVVVAFRLGQCEKLLRYGKLAASSLGETVGFCTNAPADPTTAFYPS